MVSRIEKALHKVRQARAEVPPSRTTPVIATGEITYTQTRKIDVPLKTLRENRVITGYEASIEASAYKMLRTQVLQQFNENKLNVLAITSPTLGAGKTLTAINLALSISLEVDTTVLLVDADLRQPSVHRYFGQKPTQGLSEYLTDGIALQQLLVNPGLGRFIYLPGGQALLNSSEMLSSPKMVALVEELKSRYSSRIIVFDLPPVLRGDDAIAFAHYIDATLLVLEDGVTQEQEVIRAAELLKSTHLIGTVLNKSKEANNHGYMAY